MDSLQGISTRREKLWRKQMNRQHLSWYLWSFQHGSYCLRSLLLMLLTRTLVPFALQKQSMKANDIPGSAYGTPWWWVDGMSRIQCEPLEILCIEARIHVTSEFVWFSESANLQIPSEKGATAKLHTTGCAAMHTGTLTWCSLLLQDYVDDLIEYLCIEV